MKHLVGVRGWSPDTTPWWRVGPQYKATMGVPITDQAGKRFDSWLVVSPIRVEKQQIHLLLSDSGQFVMPCLWDIAH